MATEIGKGVIPVTFDKHQIGRDLSSSIEGGAKQSEGAIGSTFKRLAGLATAAFAGVEVLGFFKDSVAAARESNKVAAQTEAVIASTGGAANLTAEQFSKLADSIAAKTGIDDEQIQTVENLLATFVNLKDAVGDGNDIFSQTTKIAVDMGVALGGDASSNAIQLGKALNDPIRGLASLTRVGVTFTDEQRNLITGMQESGDLMGAQRVILAELSKEFGGSAEATATAGAKFGVFFGNIQESIGKFLIPLMDDVAEWAMTTLPGVFKTFQDAADKVIPPLTSIGQVIGTVLTPMLAFFADHWDQLKVVLIVVGGIIGGLLLIGLSTMGIVLLATAVFCAAVLAAVVLLIQGFQWLWEKLEPVRNILGEVASVVTGVLLVAFGYVGEAVVAVTGWLQTLWEKSAAVRDFLADAFRAGIDALRGAFDALRGGVDAVIATMVWAIDKAKELFGWLTKVGAGGWNPFSGTQHSADEFSPEVRAKLGISANAAGDIFDHPTLGWMGEAGREVLLPLTNAGRTWELAGKSGLFDVLAKGMPRMHMPGVAAALDGGRGGNTYQLTSGTVVVQEAEDIPTGMRRLELMAGRR